MLVAAVLLVVNVADTFHKEDSVMMGTYNTMTQGPCERLLLELCRGAASPPSYFRKRRDQRVTVSE